MTDLRKKFILLTIVNRLENQASFAFEGGRCRYRAEFGERRCVAGALISDEHYDRSIEGKGCGHPDVRDALKKSSFGLSEEELIFIIDLQFFHDRQAQSKSDPLTKRKPLKFKDYILSLQREIEKLEGDLS